jgi:branched-chain amino acid transport system permease protein
LINGFIAAVFGGFGSPLAGLGGGIAIGVITSFFATYVSSGHAMLLLFLIMLGILAFRPQGLFVR